MSGVIDSKLHRPAASGLTRPRLIDPLVQDGGPGVAVVIAPPGAGKTTLLARAAAATSGPVAWCCIGPEDRSGPGFLAHVARSLMLDPGPESALPQDVSELLVAHPAGAGVPMSLFLDDVHELVGGTAEGHLADLLRWRPDNLRVVLGTRRPLSVNTPGCWCPTPSWSSTARTCGSDPGKSRSCSGWCTRSPSRPRPRPP